MNKSLIAAVATAAGLLAAGTARAGDVHWSIGINLPPVGTVISNAPVYAPPPVVYAPPPVVYAPPPVVYHSAPRVVCPARLVVGRPVPIAYGQPYYGHKHGWGDRDRDGIPDRPDRYDNRRDWGDRDRDGVPNWKDGYDNRRNYYRDERKYRH